MEDLSLHILDIAENSVEAGAKNIMIFVGENVSTDLLTLEITDDGKGLDPAVVQGMTDPFYTTRTTRRVGLGLALLEEAAKMANGRLEIHSIPEKGTKVMATFQLSHIDRKPLGKIPETITAILSRRPDIDIVYTHEKNGSKFMFRSVDIREQFGGLPVNSVGTLNFIRRYLVQEENNLLH
jgi:anti-sigma regulatory factor (Ser/Thr protein kinase)